MDSPTCLPRPLLCSREEAVERARAWIDTPYVLGGRVRGAGCDCATLIAEYMIECGMAPREELGLYSHDWFCNTSEDRYLFGLIRHARKTLEGICQGTPDARPGCIILFRVAGSRLYNHGGIVTRWPMFVHALDPRVTESNATTHYMTSFREMCLFDPWNKPTC